VRGRDGISSTNLAVKYFDLLLSGGRRELSKVILDFFVAELASRVAVNTIVIGLRLGLCCVACEEVMGVEGTPFHLGG
jgi:hypothetical protein